MATEKVATERPQTLSELFTLAKENLKENPQVSIICLDSNRRSCRIWGTAEVLDSGPLYDEAAAAMAARNMKPKHVVNVKVDEVEVNQPGTS